LIVNLPSFKFSSFYSILTTLFKEQTF